MPLMYLFNLLAWVLAIAFVIEQVKKYNYPKVQSQKTLLTPVQKIKHAKVELKKIMNLVDEAIEAGPAQNAELEKEMKDFLKLKEPLEDKLFDIQHKYKS